MADQMMIKAAAQSLRITPVENDKKPDRHKKAIVQEVNSDGSYQAAILDAPDTPIKCTKGCDAAAGDLVLVLITDGEHIAICKLG